MTRFSLILFLLLLAQAAYALEPGQILIIANGDVNESVRLAEYYCSARAVPAENILKVPLGRTLAEQMTRLEYDKVLAPAIRKDLAQNRPTGQIRCLLTVYGVPIKIAPAAPAKDTEQLVSKLSKILTGREDVFKQTYSRLNKLGRAELAEPQNSSQTESVDNILKHLADDTKQAAKRIEYIEQTYKKEKQYNEWLDLLRYFYGPVYAQQQAENLPQIPSSTFSFDKNKLNQAAVVLQTAEQQKWSINKKLEDNFYSASEFAGGLVKVISDLKADIDKCRGIGTNASVDSELSMVLSNDYDLYRWQDNEMKGKPLWLPTETLMVSRLDAPSAKIAAELIDKAIKAEKTGLSGTAYIDTRGLAFTDQPTPNSFEFFDKSLHLLADILKKRTAMNVVVENTGSLFAPGSCPNTAIYCGWYSVKKYIDAFDFVPGAIGFHIASFEAADLRNPKSSNWCPAMLSDGITATLGPVDEPFLHSFPEPDKFFVELFDGKCLVEAFYRTKPFNSWQMLLIGDPLYKLTIK